MGAGTDGAAGEERDPERPSADDPAGERSYEDGWYRSLAAWGRVGARADDPRGANEAAYRSTDDEDRAAHDDRATDVEDAKDDEEIASP
jgi:hypothetical protein